MEERAMRIDIRVFGKTKLAKIYVSNTEQNTQQDEINKEIEALQKGNCIIVLYRSGKADLTSSTSKLLWRNVQ